MITTNTIAAISPSLRALIQRLREEVLTFAATDEGAADPAVIDGLTKVFDEAGLLVEELRLAEERVATDPRLSAMGQREAMVKAVTDIRTRLAFVTKAAKDRQVAADAERKALEAIPKASGDAVVAQLEAMEIREQLRRLSMSQRMDLYAKATMQVIPVSRALSKPRQQAKC